MDRASSCWGGEGCSGGSLGRLAPHGNRLRPGGAWPLTLPRPPPGLPGGLPGGSDPQQAHTWACSTSSVPAKALSSPRSQHAHQRDGVGEHRERKWRRREPRRLWESLVSVEATCPPVASCLLRGAPVGQASRATASDARGVGGLTLDPSVPLPPFPGLQTPSISHASSPQSSPSFRGGACGRACQVTLQFHCVH